MTHIPGNYQYKALYSGNPIQKHWHRAKMQLISTAAPPPQGSRVLDAACGSGIISYFLSSFKTAVLGVDINPEAISFAKRTFKKKNLQFKCSSIFDITDRPFQRIYCIEAIEHFEENETELLLKHFKTLIAPGGKLLVTTPNYASTWPIIEWGLDTFSLVPKLRDTQHRSKFTPKKLELLLMNNGWEPIEMGTFNGIAPFMAPLSTTLSNLLCKRELKTRSRPWRNLIYALATPK